MPGIPPDLAREIAAHEFVCGSDEVGYGSWAGPLVVCAAVVPRTWTAPAMVRDSKQLSATARDRLFPSLVSTITHFLVSVEVEEIDRRGVGTVLLEAHAKAIQGALDAHRAQGHSALPFVIIDGSRGVLGAVALPKADALIPAVSAASIIAKVARDRHMVEMDAHYPGYSFRSNAGYGTKEHQAALDRLGVCAIHRRSYAPIAERIGQSNTEIQEAWMHIDEINGDI